MNLDALCLSSVGKAGDQMPTVRFKAKPETIYNMDETPAWTWVKVPKLTRTHCDMDAFRQDVRFRSYANSDLFLSLLTRTLEKAGIKSHIRLDDIPNFVTIEPVGFLYTVTIEV